MIFRGNFTDVEALFESYKIHLRFRKEGEVYHLISPIFHRRNTDSVPLTFYTENGEPIMQFHSTQPTSLYIFFGYFLQAITLIANADIMTQNKDNYEF